MKSNLKRQYLNEKEKNFYMISKSFLQTINGERNIDNTTSNEVWVEWGKRGMITPSMQKNLKLVKAYLNKFCDEVEINLDEREQDKLKKQLDKFDFRLIDDYTLKKIFKDINDRARYITLEKSKILPIIEELSDIKCVGCKKDYKGCPIYDIFDDMLLERVEELPNCPYACDLSELTEIQKNNILKLREKMKSKNKVGKGIVSESDT